jgi:hypothetical protein
MKSIEYYVDATICELLIKFYDASALHDLVDDEIRYFIALGLHYWELAESGLEG